MAKVGAQRAAELTGKSKSTIQRAMNAGKLSYEMDNHIHALTMQTLVPEEWRDQGLKIHKSPACLSLKS